MTAEIPLTKGYVALVDEEDADLADTSWCIHDSKARYASRAIRKDGKRRLEYLHRAVMERKIGRKLRKGERVDHQNGNGLDNQRENIRFAEHGQNIHNQLRARSQNKSGLRGASWHRQNRLWRSQIVVNGKHMNLGCYQTAEEAHRAYRQASLKHYGEYSPYYDGVNRDR